MPRGSQRRCSVRKGVLRNFAKFTGEHMCQALFFNKVAGLRFATLLNKRLWHRRFTVNFAIFLRTPFLPEHLRWLVLCFVRKLLVYHLLIIPWRIIHYRYIDHIIQMIIVQHFLYQDDVHDVTPFCSLSIADFEEVNVCWVPTYSNWEKKSLNERRQTCNHLRQT